MQVNYCNDNICSLADPLVKDLSYIDKGESTFGGFGSLMVLLMMGSLNKFTPSFVNILLGGRK